MPFTEVHQDVQQLRVESAKEGEQKLKSSVYNTTDSDLQWKEGWEKLMKNGVYETEFGDLLPIG